MIAAASAAAIFSCTPRRAALPVGVFDSGTGGFTVLEKILALDAFDNATGENDPDGVPDLLNEDFQYLADQANMPYGKYDAEGKASYLTDLAVKDAFFLIGDGYCKDASSIANDCIKSGVKIVVIGCNTATAYGLDAIRDTLKALGADIDVIGVVEAGSRSAVEYLESRFDEASVGVLATPGTISSGVYERMLKAAAGDDLRLQVVSQSGYGFAGAVDEEKEYVDKSLTTFSDSYLGPVLGTSEDSIFPDLLPCYGFDFTGNKAFLETSPDGKPLRIQLNSPDNYARFNIVNLVAKAVDAGLEEPLRCVILGCTHYPFELATLRRTLSDLRAYQDENGARPYERFIAEDCIFVDPAENTALDCYLALKERGLLSRRKTPGTLDAFISVPSAHLPDSCLAPGGGLAYWYKYGREINDPTVSTVVVPMSKNTVNEDNMRRVEKLLPNCWKLLSEKHHFD